MKIYTRTGDEGKTGLWGGGRVPKYHSRVAAYGDIDELNSCLGAARAALEGQPLFVPLNEALAQVQKELFMVGALLATPADKLSRLSPPFNQGLPPGAAARLEKEIDALTAELKPLDQFILPGGSTPGAWLHLARAVCRRAERGTVHLASLEKVPDGLIVYLNRLSDYLFTAARWVNGKLGRAEAPWQGLEKA